MPAPGMGYFQFDPGQFMQNNDLPAPYSQEQPQDYNSIAAAMGVTMPSIPQRDSLGMYGITDAQNQSADNRAFGNVLFGAAQSMFNRDPNAVLQAGMQAGGIRDSMLSQYSQQNIADYGLRVKEALAKLDSLDKMSDIQLQRTNIRMNEEKLKEMELQREVAKKWGEAMMPMASAELAKLRTTDPELATQMEGQLIGVQKSLAAGNLEAAEAQLNAAMEMSPEYFQRSMARGMVKETARASAKYGMLAEMLPKIQEMVSGMPGFENYQVTIGKDGQPDFLSPEEQQAESLRNQAARQQIATNAALMGKYKAQAEASGKLDYKSMIKQVGEVERAIQAIGEKQPIDPTAMPAWQKRQSDAMAALQSIGVDPSDTKAIEALKSGGRDAAYAKVRETNMLAYALANNLPIPGMSGQPGAPGAGGRNDVLLAHVLGDLKRGLAQDPTPEEANKLVAAFQRAPSPEAQAIFIQTVAENGPLYSTNPVAFLKALEKKMEMGSGYSATHPSDFVDVPPMASDTLFLPQ